MKGAREGRTKGSGGLSNGICINVGSTREATAANAGDGWDLKVNVCIYCSEVGKTATMLSVVKGQVVTEESVVRVYK